MSPWNDKNTEVQEHASPPIPYSPLPPLSARHHLPRRFAALFVQQCDGMPPHLERYALWPCRTGRSKIETQIFRDSEGRGREMWTAYARFGWGWDRTSSLSISISNFSLPHLIFAGRATNRYTQDKSIQPTTLGVTNYIGAQRGAHNGKTGASGSACPWAVCWRHSVELGRQQSA